MKKLTYEEYQAAFQAPMLDVTTTAEPVLDIWPYVEAVPSADLDGYVLLDGIVKYVYQHPTEKLLHVLVSTDDKNVFLVVLIDLGKPEIVGHYLLNLLQLYSIA
ncbi:hypothetical protein HER32_15845 [Hymenobacter sp. BT18]|uniref:hypothetical protein n=1 Tax=Hymenobacter sp. BT18 TaxID=2835648 RepID=UPI00143E8EBD|nr:hypothetical protein [Hymenobacter sp. BT18]QIX62566.1 hypothetical protein HER32_15845 [Hymenobacter sp. BT18]